MLDLNSLCKIDFGQISCVIPIYKNEHPDSLFSLCHGHLVIAHVPNRKAAHVPDRKAAHVLDREAAHVLDSEVAHVLDRGDPCSGQRDSSCS